MDDWSEVMMLNLTTDVRFKENDAAEAVSDSSIARHLINCNF
jgi:hypothetical protein